MGKPLRGKPLSQGTINRLMANNPSNRPQAQQNPTQSPAPVAKPTARQPITLKHQSDFDSLSPVERIREFVSFANDVLARYDEDVRRQGELEQQTQDLLHYMELSDNMNACRGYCMYSKMAEIRRERRACKNEIDLLQPLYDFLKDKAMINQLAQIQGKCRTSKEAISMRTYTLRTDVV